jgi:hypothetical protein
LMKFALSFLFWTYFTDNSNVQPAASQIRPERKEKKEKKGGAPKQKAKGNKKAKGNQKINASVVKILYQKSPF